jgi:hypothetical protein
MIMTRAILLLTAFSGLMGCAAVLPDSNPAAKGTMQPLSKAALAGGDVVVSSGDGYCIDGTSRKANFVVLASCLAQTKGQKGAQVPPALITVSTSNAHGQSALPAPADFAKTSQSAIAAGQQAADYTSVRLSGSQSMVDGADDSHWRAAFRQGDRMVGLALYAPKGSALAGPEGGRILQNLHARIKTASRDHNKSAPTESKSGLLGVLFKR